MNVAEQYLALKRRAERRHNLTESAHLTYAFAFAMFHEAEVEIQRRKRLLTAEDDQAIVSGQIPYTLPADFMDGLVRDGVLYILSSVVEATLTEMSETEARNEYDGFYGLENATPVNWFYKGGSKAIGICPPASSGTLRLIYWKRPDAIDPATGIYDGSSVGATFTLSDATVTPASLTTIAEGQFTGDGTWQIGKGTLESPPTVWRTIESVTTSGGYITSLEMDSVYDGPTAAAQSFIVAKVSNLSKLYTDDAMGLLPVFYALDDLEAAAEPGKPSWRERFESTIASIGRSHPQVRQLGVSVGNAFGSH